MEFEKGDKVKVKSSLEYFKGIQNKIGKIYSVNPDINYVNFSGYVVEFLVENVVKYYWLYSHEIKPIVAVGEQLLLFDW